ncbi:MAG: mechanosensitive ion channel protein MscS, partial [Thiohalocapsa sp.]
MSNQATSVQTGDAGEHRDLRARGAPGRLRLSPGRSLWARGCLCALLLTLPAVAPPSAFGQAGQGSASDPPATGAAADQLKESGIKPRLSAKVVETRIDETEASTTLTEEEKKALTEQYRATLTNLEEVENFNAQAAAFAAAIDIAPKEAAAIQAELDATQDQSLEPDVELPESATVADIEHLLARLQAELAAVDAKLGEIDKILEDPQQQPQQLRARLTEIRRELETTEADLQTAAATDEGIVADEARQWALETRRDALRAQLLMLDQQVLSTDARQELATARRALLKATGEQLRTNRAFLENEADRLRRLDAERASAEAEAAERETAGAHALVRDLAEQNADLSDEIAAVTAKLAPLDEQQASVERDTERIEQQYRSAQQRVEAAGLSRALSQALIDLRNQLPDHAALRRRSDARAETIAETTLAQIRYRDELRQLRPVGAFVDELLMAVDVDPSSREQLREEVSKQVERRIDLLERMLSIQQSYLRAVTELDFAASQQLEATERFEAFLAERLLWVRSVPPLTEQDFAAIPDAINWLVSPTHWREVLDTLLNLAARAPAFWLGLAVVALLLWRGRALRAAIRASGEKLRRISTDRFSYTLQALGLTLLAAAPGPLLLALVGWGLSTSLEASAFAKAIGTALIAISLALYYWSAFLLLCMPGGVADQHFRWNSDTLALLRRTFAWGAAVLLPLGFVAAALFEHQDPDFNGTLGRLALAAVNIGLALLTAKLMHPRQGVLQHVLADRPNGWANRLRLLWYPALIAGPVALAGLALTGYLYTSGILLESLVSELWLVLALVVTHEVIVRWLIVTRRSLALKAALERRAQREAERTGPQAQEPERPEVFSIPEPDVDLASLDAQTRRLLNTGIFIAAAVGLWLIWSDVLPALNVLEGVTLWSYT